ncbi:MAG: glycosyltransferase family 4 protein [Bacilli bacterium]|jgi:glycosyltransferase involved in cell wall biosynthesis
MHVLFIFNHPAPYKVRLFNELSEEIEVTALFERLKNGDRDPRFYTGEKNKFHIARIRGINLGCENHLSNGIAKHLQNHRYDLIVMNGWHTFSEMAALRYLKKHNIPYLFYINGGIIRAKEPRFMRKIKTKYIGGASLYFSPDENSNRYLAYYGADLDKIVNYPYSTIYENEILTLPVDAATKQSLRQELGVASDKLFVSCGQFILRKNYERLISYWKTQPANYRLAIIGGGKEKNKYQKLIKDNNLQNVTLIDFVPREKLFKYLQAADAYIFPSKEDIYGHVINEALSQGLPVISNNKVNSALRLIDNGVNGYVIDIEKDEEISNAINNVLKNMNMPGEALKTARQNTIERMARVHIDNFKKWMNK